ncbi:hypothetical protein CRM22_003933 [Opisthorchis felineus]|uniref:Uncharacterized protein n=1 Tax=Opisthorchis felineus TaxID=147828 RepID=A0A4S2LYP2_OPIFE|nr:hypothetical protein CRM22_003933 [Opisthorchis felineus]TGZ69055.1 hypothetical protein CRM22_003933 [Opisthorchis felineus]
MREDLVKKFESLQRLRQQLSQRSSKIRQIQLRKDILTTALSAFPPQSNSAGRLKALYNEANTEDVKLRPWKRKHKKSIDCSRGRSCDNFIASSELATPSTIPQGPSKSQWDSLRKDTLEWKLEKALDNRQPDLAQKLSDLIHERDIRSSALATATAVRHVRNSVQAKQESKCGQRS